MILAGQDNKILRRILVSSCLCLDEAQNGGDLLQ